MPARGRAGLSRLTPSRGSREPGDLARQRRERSESSPSRRLRINPRRQSQMRDRRLLIRMPASKAVRPQEAPARCTLRKAAICRCPNSNTRRRSLATPRRLLLQRDGVELINGPWIPVFGGMITFNVHGVSTDGRGSPPCKVTRRYTTSHVVIRHTSSPSIDHAAVSPAVIASRNASAAPTPVSGSSRSSPLASSYENSSA